MKFHCTGSSHFQQTIFISPPFHFSISVFSSFFSISCSHYFHLSQPITFSAIFVFSVFLLLQIICHCSFLRTLFVSLSPSCCSFLFFSYLIFHLFPFTPFDYFVSSFFTPASCYIFFLHNFEFTLNVILSLQRMYKGWIQPV